MPPVPSRLQHAKPHRRQQKGIALVVALVLLVIMTLVGLNSMRSVTLEERMTGHTFDRSLSFQAAEAALREAEAFVEANKPSPAALSACISGICGSPAPTATPRWLDDTFNSWRTAAQIENGNIDITPQYFVEYLGATYACDPNSPASATTCRRYRVTARSNAGNDRASVVLQSIYATE